MKCDKLIAEKLTAYELKDGAYGMYLAVDGWAADVDFGSYFYRKEQVDERIKAMEKHIAELKAENESAEPRRRSTNEPRL